MKTLLHKFISLRFVLMFIMMLCWIIPTMILGLFMGGHFFKALQEKTEAFLVTGAEQAKSRTLENIDKAVTLLKDAVYDGELAAAVYDYRMGKITHDALYSQCRSYLERKYGRESLCDFALFFQLNDPKTILFTADAYQEASYFSQYVQPFVLALGQELDTRCYFYQQDGQTYLVRNMYNTSLERYGMLLLGIDMKQLLAHLQVWSEEWDAPFDIILDGYQSGEITYLEAAEGLSEHGNLLLYTMSAQKRDYHFRFQVQASKQEVYHEMETFRALMAWMFGLIVPLYVLMMYFVERRIIRPIHILSKASSRIRNGEFGITVPLRGKDELGQLGNAFSDMSLQLKTLVEKSYKEELALRDARIQAMQSRINPHFLNNALETINWQARMEESETISAMVEALSLLLNASMDRAEQHLVPLQEELKVAEAYFYFVGLRFGDRLTVWQDVQEGLEDFPVPRLVIQTLLENAIEHGVEPAGGGRIRVHVFAEGEWLVIEVTNNGRLLSVEDRRRIAELLLDDADVGEHLGIRNVARRLRLLYDGQARLTIDSDAQGETVACMRIPIEQKEKK